MMFFSDLPHDLFKSITEEYLQIDVHQLSLLDVAYCNRKQRSDLLALLRGTRASYSRKRITSGAMPAYLQWVISRVVQVSKLEIGLAAFQDSRLTTLGPLPGAVTVDIVDERLSAVQNTSLIAINVVQFLNQFPVLKMLRIWQSMDAYQFPVLRRLTCRLEGLDLMPCSRLRNDAAGVAALLAAVGRYLQVLRCESTDGKLLPAIAEHCHCLITLDIHIYHDLSSTHVLEQVCSVNALTLKALFLDAELPQKTLLMLLPCCPNLEYFKTTSSKMQSIPFIEAIFMHCVKIKELQLPQVLLTKSPTEEMMEIKKQCWSPHYALCITDQIALLSVIPIPICAYQMQFSDEASARPVLEYIGARYGSTIRALDLHLGHMAIHGESVRNLLLKCPNLTEFKISPWSKAMSVLPSACRKIETIHCGGSSDDFADLLANFKAIPHNSATEFVFPSNVALKAELLIAVAEAFPRLHQLSIVDGKTDKTSLLELILSGKITAKRIRLHSGTASWIAEQLTKVARKHHRDGNCIVLPV